jgi:hypothetical protein
MGLVTVKRGKIKNGNTEKRVGRQRGAVAFFPSAGFLGNGLLRLSKTALTR